MRCKFGHVTPQNLGSTKPSYSTEWKYLAFNGLMYLPPPSVERKGTTQKCFKEFYLKAKARIWPRLPYLFRIRLPAALGQVRRMQCHDAFDPSVVSLSLALSLALWLVSVVFDNLIPSEEGTP